MMRIHLAVAVIVGGLMFGTRNVVAQAPSQSPGSPKSCDVYARALEEGGEASSMADAKGKIGSCRAHAGRAYAKWLERLARSGTREQAEEMLDVPFGLRDGTLFATAVGIASDRTASSAAREVALVLLFDQTGRYLIGPLSEYERGIACALPAPSTPPQELRGRTPLPADYVAVASAVIDSLAGEDERVTEVRQVATCVKKNLYRRVHWLTRGLPELHPTVWEDRRNN